MISNNMDKYVSHSAINILPVVQHKSNDMEKSINTNGREENLAINPNEKNRLEQKHIRSANNYLRIEVIQKMIYRFLIEKKMPKQNLAEALEITVRSLNQLCSNEAPPALILKINLSLIKLYCQTKF
jgi:DNA-binding Xre family transcriptional regulator